MKPWQKIALTVVLSLAIFSLVAIAGIFSLLPHPATVGAMLRRAPPPQTPHITKTSQRPSAETVAAPSPKPALDPAGRKKLVSEKFIDRYLTDDRIQSRVCDNLTSSIVPFKNVDEFASQLEKSLLGESPLSATAEAVMLPIEFTLKNEAVRDLVDQAKNAADRGDTGFVRKAQFYAQALRATASVLSTQDQLEAISADAYQLYALSRATALRPEMLQDPETGDFCRGIERAAVDGVNRDENFDRDRMARLLAKYDITNESIGYDPHISTRLRVVTTDAGLQIKMPWLEAVFNTAAKASR